MFDPANLLAFLTASVLLTLMPGPDILFVSATSMAHGARSGIAIALGLCTGLVVHTLAAALGIAVLLQQSALAFQLLKYAGALYLLYLAWQSLREGKTPSEFRSVPPQPFLALYRRGILMNVLNPKVALFFLAFLPQFVVASAESAALQMAFLGLVFMVQAILVFSLVSLFAERMGRWLRKTARHPRITAWGQAALFAALGIRLAFFED